MSQRCWVRHPVWAPTFVSPSTDSRGAVVSYWRKYVHEVLVNHLGGLSLSRKSVVRLTDCPDMILDVYRGRKTTTTQTHSKYHLSLDTCPTFLQISASVILNNWYLKVNFLGPENLLWDISTVIILNIGTDRSEQTVRTQIRLLLMEQSDQGLLCLLFCLHFWTQYCTVKSNCSICRTIMVIISGVPIFRIFTVLW